MSRRRAGRPGVGNRIVLGVVGLLALVAAAWFVLMRLDLAGSWGIRQPDAGAPFLDVPGDWRGRRASWVLAGAGAVLVALGLWWLIRQIPERWRVRRFSFGQDGSVDDGVTDVTTDALAGAVADDVASLPDVATATVRFFGARAEPEMLVRIDVEDGADVGALRAGLERDVLPDLERSLGARLAHVGVQIRTGARIKGQSEFVPTAVDHHLL